MTEKNPFWRIGLWTGMFYRHGLPFEETLLLLRQAGFQCCELCEMYASALLKDEAFRRVPSDVFPITQCHGRNFSQKFEDLFSMLEYFGIKTCVFHPLPERSETLRLLKTITPSASEHGVRIALENLIGVPGKSLAEFLDAESDIGVNIDTAHASANGEDSADLIRFYGEKVYGVHLSDSDGGQKDCHLIPGTGVLDWDSILSALKEVNYDGDLHLELPHVRTEDKESTFQNALIACQAFSGIMEKNNEN